MSYPPRIRTGSMSTPSAGHHMAPPGYKPATSYYSTPTRPSAQQMAQAQAHAQAQAQAQAYRSAPQHPMPVVHKHASTYPAGPLGFFLPPPGQRTMDPTLSTPPVTQAMLTTYPSRLRTGVTSLVQPETVTGSAREREAFLAELDRELAQPPGTYRARSSGASTPRVESPAPRAGRTTTTTLSGRRAGRVNYAENDSEEEEESSEDDIEEAPSDPEDDTYGERRRRRDRIAGEHEANRIAKVRRRQTEMERGWTWLGERVPAERVTSNNAKRTGHTYIDQERLAHEADRPEMLVPITVDYDVPSPQDDGTGIKIKDRFMWNANEPFLTPIDFATIFCEDLGIPPQPHATTLAELITAQVEEAQNTVAIDLETRDATPDDVVFSDDEVDNAIEIDDDADKEKAWAEPDCRIIINLDVQIFTSVLRDRIEWDLSSPLPPSEFARHYCAELGLTGEAIPLITHAIHEELIKHKRDALELDLFAHTHPLEQAKWEKGGPSNIPRTTNRTGARPLVGVWRDWWERDEFGPVFIELSTEDMERREVERNREARRMMRTLATSKRRR